MYYNRTKRIDFSNTSPLSSSLTLSKEKKSVIYKEEKAKHVSKNKVDKNINRPRNLIPTNYNQFMSTILSSQEKWNIVFEKFIEKADELESSNKPIEVKEVKAK